MKKRVSLVLASIVLILFPLSAGGNAEEYIEAIREGVLAKSEAGVKTADAISTDMASLTSLYRYVDSIYFEDVDKEAVKEKLTTALIEALGDRYSFYTPPERAEDYTEEVTGKYGGIGVYLTKPNPLDMDVNKPSTYMITIESTMPGTPAQRAGLRSHDMISAVDGEEVDNLTSTEASKKLRGEAGTEVTVTIHRNDQVFDITLTREVIDKPVVESTVVDGDIGYVALNEFSATTSSQLMKEIRQLKAQNIKYLIIDERYNGGGDVDESMKCANMFLPAGKTIVSLEGRKGSGTSQKYTSTGTEQIGEDIPIVLLVNGSSASSSEIFAAALHDNKRATLIGTRTFGKGIFQTVFPYGDGFIQITTGRYYTPTGLCIHGTGIEPDIEVADNDFKDEELPAYEKMLKEKVIGAFVDAHPENTEENIALFAEEQKESGIRSEILRVLVHNEYVYRMDYDDRPLAQSDYDPPLSRAIEFIRSGE